MNETLRHQEFTPHVGKRFTFPAQTVTLVLDRIEMQPPSGVPALARDPFILIFRGPPGIMLPEGFYPAEVEDGPMFEIYVMPIRTLPRDRQEYQAVFN